MRRLAGGLQNYAWGSHTLLAELRGEAASAQPEAEIWYGAHPSTDTLFDDGLSLLECIERDPVESVGQPIVDRFGPKLPFLLKLLAAGSPLSIQAHPSIEQAKAGFAAEDAAGVDRSDPKRSFKDDNHKPELICALTQFEALVGFRPVEETLRFFAHIGFGALDEILREHGPKAAVSYLLGPTDSDHDDSVSNIVSELVDRCANLAASDWAGESALICRLAETYPGDAGIVVASLLNYVILEPSQALYLGAGNMHAYVSGLAVEVMANSDNVLRGGLTPKHIDVVNLLDVVLPDTVTPTPVEVDGDGRYLTPAPEFELRQLALAQTPVVHGPSIVLCTEGLVVVTQGAEAIELGPTEACWLANGESGQVSGTEDRAWHATVGSPTTLIGG